MRQVEKVNRILESVISMCCLIFSALCEPSGKETYYLEKPNVLLTSIYTDSHQVPTTVSPPLKEKM